MMIKTKQISLLVMLGLAVASIGVGMRKQVAGQEIIPMNRSIAVINGESDYLNDKLCLELRNGRQVFTSLMNKDGYALFKDLENGKPYTLVIGRTDIVGRIKYKKMIQTVTPEQKQTHYIVLVGASIGKDWAFEKIPQRLKLSPRFVFGNRTIYDFDKSKAVDILSRIPVPVSTVILKECSAYFPRDLDTAKTHIEKWVSQLRQADIPVVLATIAPVTKGKAQNDPPRQASLLAFNDFIRDYARRNSIKVLDLEAALSYSRDERYLKDAYAQDDGVHLNTAAYTDALDGLVRPLLTDFMLGSE